MEALIKAVEQAIKQEEGMVKYHEEKLATESKYHEESKVVCQQRVLDLKSDLDELRAIIKKKVTA